MDPRYIDLRKLNSATKYPSIPTFHEMTKERGQLGPATEPSRAPSSWRSSGPLLMHEKIDGTNARIIVLQGARGDVGGAEHRMGGYIIGSREELLHAEGDLIANPAQGIVDVVLPFAQRARQTSMPVNEGGALVLYGEAYGGNITAGAKHYTDTKRTGFRLFDVLVISNALEIMSWPIERIAAWRDAGHQEFADDAVVNIAARTIECQRVPFLGTINVSELPQSIEDTDRWLRSVVGHQTFAALDGEGGRPEGMVLRTPDRKAIAKLRFEDYERTLRARAKK